MVTTISLTIKQNTFEIETQIISGRDAKFSVHYRYLQEAQLFDAEDNAQKNSSLLFFNKNEKEFFYAVMSAL